MTGDGDVDCHVAMLSMGATLAPRNDGGGLVIHNRQYITAVAPGQPL